MRYRDPNMGMGIAISPNGNDYSPFLYYGGIEKFMIPVSIWGSPYGNED
jgi:hypothetical protein